MMSDINYRDNLFKRYNITTIHGEPTSKMLRKLQNEIKANAKSVYSNLVGRSHGHLGLVFTDSQYTLILPTPSVYPTHPGPLVIPYGTTYHANSNIWTAHTYRVRLFQEVMGVDQALMQQIVATVEEAYLADIRNRTTNYINNTVTDVLTHLQDNYSQVVTHELLKHKDIVKKTIYNPR